MNKKVVISFPICLKEFFFDNIEDLKKIKKNQSLPGFELISLKTNQNNLEVKIPCHIQGLNDKKQTYFVFLLPKKILGRKKTPNPETFFKKGLCRVEGVSNFNNCTLLVFNGDYESENTSLIGKIIYYNPPHFGW